MNFQYSNSKVGVYIDVSNLYMNGGQRMQYQVLREFAARDGGELVRLNAYASFDAERAQQSVPYAENVNKFYAVLRDLGYKVITKEVKWYEDEMGRRYGKANADLDLAVDVLLQAENLDRVLLATGDGDFTRVVLALQNRGCRVEVVSLSNVSRDLRYEADMFVSGYLIPNLIPTSEHPEQEAAWGELGSRVRGVCYAHKQGYGFMRFLKSIAPGLWLTDSRRTDSPYGSVFFHDSLLPSSFNPNLLPSYNHIFEFRLAKSPDQEKYEAVDIEHVCRLPA